LNLPVYTTSSMGSAQMGAAPKLTCHRSVARPVAVAFPVLSVLLLVGVGVVGISKGSSAGISSPGNLVIPEPSGDLMQQSGEARAEWPSNRVSFGGDRESAANVSLSELVFPEPSGDLTQQVREARVERPSNRVSFGGDRQSAANVSLSELVFPEPSGVVGPKRPNVLNSGAGGPAASAWKVREKPNGQKSSDTAPGLSRQATPEISLRELVIPEPSGDRAIGIMSENSPANRAAQALRGTSHQQGSGASLAGGNQPAVPEVPLRDLVVPEPRYLPPSTSRVPNDMPAIPAEAAPGPRTNSGSTGWHSVPKNTDALPATDPVTERTSHSLAASAGPSFPVPAHTPPGTGPSQPPLPFGYGANPNLVESRAHLLEKTIDKWLIPSELLEASGPQASQPRMLNAAGNPINTEIAPQSTLGPRLGPQAIPSGGDLGRIAAVPSARPANELVSPLSVVRAQAVSTSGDASEPPVQLQPPLQPTTQTKVPAPLSDEEKTQQETPVGESSPDTATAGPNPPSDTPAAGGGEQTLGEAQQRVVTEESQQRNLRFLRRQSVLLDPGEYEFDVTFQYLVDEADYVLVRRRGDAIEIGEAMRRERLLLLPLEFRLGLSRDTQVFVNVPFGWSNSELAFLLDEDFSNAGGIGDVSAGITRLLCEGDECGPDILATLAFSAATGKADIVTALAVPGSSLGEGFWSLTAGLTFIQTYDPVVIFYGGGYRHRFDATFDGDIEVEPGQQAFYRLGVGFAINSNVTLSATFLGSYIGANTVNGIRIAGGIQEPMQVRLAATVSRNKKCNPNSCLTVIEPFVNFGITDDAVDSLFGISWTF
jgi:hypothetical protein